MFHASLLSPYQETELHGPNYHKPPPEIIEGEPEYEVEAIIGSRRTRKNKRLQYRIRWKGYSAAHDSWEPANQIHAPELIKEYQMTKLKRKLQIQYTSATMTKAEPLKREKRQELTKIKRDSSQDEISINSCTMSSPVDQAFNNVVQIAKATEAEMLPPRNEDDEGTTQVESLGSSSQGSASDYEPTAEVLLTQSIIRNPQLL